MRAKQHVIAPAKSTRRGAPQGKRSRGGDQNEMLPFVPPEDWHEPRDDARDYRFVVQPAGPGFRHILTPEEIRDRLAQLPGAMLRPLEVVQLSRMTRKKTSFPCYGMQWGASIYLYPLEEELVEFYPQAPGPMFMNEVRMFGGRWIQDRRTAWKLVWTEEAIKDYYLNNILIHELGHLLDDRNHSYVDRERYAEWFAIHHGYKPTRHPSAKKTVVRRHHSGA